MCYHGLEARGTISWRVILFASQKAFNCEINSIPLEGEDIDCLLDKEWLLTNKRGGFACSTITGCNTRRYHGLLTGSMRPPVKRIGALSSCLETIRIDGKEINLTGFEFNGLLSPAGILPAEFRQDTGVHFEYRLNGVELTKSIYLAAETDTAAIVYNFTRLAGPIEFEVRAFAALRDFHHLQKSGTEFEFENINNRQYIRSDTSQGGELVLSCPSMRFIEEQQWWYNILYRADRQRSQDYLEDLWTPGVYRCSLNSPRQIVLWATLREHSQEEPQQLYYFGDDDIETVREDLYRRQNELKSKPRIKLMDDVFETLCIAADKFVVRRFNEGREGWTIIAGYPWFGDWGRDALISLPGLLLSTGRFDMAKSVLTTFAQAADGGMIPNFFDECDGRACFNSIDSSLWFVRAAFQYLRASGDEAGFSEKFLPVIRRIIDCYRQGTRFGIHQDEDGLITGGDSATQLTWMDAKFDDVAFTPRYGKAVEVNALWYNCLCELGDYYSRQNNEISRKYELEAEKCRASFVRLFFNEITGYLNDCILPDGQIDATLRPNQIFAVSLAYSPLDDYQQRCVVDVVRERLLTAYGLRSLDVYDSRYKGKYEGTWRQRDAAYHQGTVWAYLIGPFVEAYLKVNQFSDESREEAKRFILPLVEHIYADGCIGQISEIFDGDMPHKARGCFAQAWSVAELIRAYLLIKS